MYDLGRQTCSTGRLLLIRYINNDNFTYIIHGTSASGGTWWRRSGGFAGAVEANHPGVWRCGNVEVTEYAWTGRNAHADRIEGGRLLAQHLGNLERRKREGEISYREVDLIAHSHGGNVVLEALRRMSENQTRVNHVALIATPHVKIEYERDSETWYDWMYFRPNVFNAVAGHFYNIYSPEDSIQGYWADVSDGISGDQIPNHERFRDMIHVSRIYTGPEAHRVINIRQNTDVGSFDAHGVLHNTVMGGAIGHLLQGVNWSAARARAGVPDTITDDDDQGE